jgi:MFS family permease
VVAKLLIDTAPLKASREFRLLFIGFLISTLGNQLTLVAIPYQIYIATHSTLQVGLISVAQLLPLIGGSLIGGSYGDHLDRRHILIWASFALSATSALLVVNAVLLDTNLVVLYVVAALAAFFGGFSNPSRAAAVPKLVDEEHLTAALAFNQVVLQFGGIVGPALAGVLIMATGVGLLYGLDALTFLVMALTSWMLRPIPPAPGATKPGLRSIGEGFTFLRGKKVLQSVYLVDLNAMIFGMPRAVFPAMALTVYKAGPGVLGLLYTAPGAGAFIGVLTTGWLSEVKRRGRAISIAVAIWGLSIAAFGFVHSVIAGCILLGVAGWADVISAVLRNTILQTSIPDHFRSRLSGIQIAVVQGGPKLGDFETGAVAALSSPVGSVVSGGLLCALGVAALNLYAPQFWRETPLPLEGDQV